MVCVLVTMVLHRHSAGEAGGGVCGEGGKEEGGSLTPPVPRQDLPVAITSIVASGGA